MEVFLTTSLSFPTAFYTVTLGFVVLYWLTVIVGALGIDVLDFHIDGAEGAIDGAAEGAAEGAMEGAAEGAVEGATDGTMDGVADAPVEGAEDRAAHGAQGSIAWIFSTFKLRGVPVTLLLSIWLIFAWIVTYMISLELLPILGGPHWLMGVLTVGVGLAAGLPLASVVVRPLRGLLKPERQAKRSDHVGKIVTIDTSRVDADFGGARAEDGGAGLILRVRAEPGNHLTRGSKASVVAFDSERDAYEVAPVHDILPSELAKK